LHSKAITIQRLDLKAIKIS